MFATYLLFTFLIGPHKDGVLRHHSARAAVAVAQPDHLGDVVAAAAAAAPLPWALLYRRQATPAAQHTGRRLDADGHGRQQEEEVPTASATSSPGPARSQSDDQLSAGVALADHTDAHTGGHQLSQAERLADALQ